MLFPLDVTRFVMAIALISLRANANTQRAVNFMGKEATTLMNFHELQCSRNNTRRSSAYTQHMWGDPDPNVFYLCDEVSNTTRQMRCPAGHGFFNGYGYYGCMPFAKWPACIDNKNNKNVSNSRGSSASRSNRSIGITRKSNDTATDSVSDSDTHTDTDTGIIKMCSDEENLQQTWAAANPNKFYVCQQKNAKPLLVNCETGKGYVSAWVSGGVGTNKENGIHIVGCATWEKWRSYMHCEEFY